MSVPLYMDHHVKHAIVRELRRRNVDVLTCAEDGSERWEDERILERATRLGRAVFTHDDDFLGVASQWVQEGREFAGLAYAHQLN